MPRLAKPLSALVVSRLSHDGFHLVGVVPGLGLNISAGARSWPQKRAGGAHHGERSDAQRDGECDRKTIAHASSCLYIGTRMDYQGILIPRPVYLYLLLTLLLLSLREISSGSRGRKTQREKSGDPTFLTGRCTSIGASLFAFSLPAALLVRLFSFATRDS